MDEKISCFVRSVDCFGLAPQVVKAESKRVCQVMVQKIYGATDKKYIGQATNPIPRRNDEGLPPEKLDEERPDLREEQKTVYLHWDNRQVTKKG